MNQQAILCALAAIFLWSTLAFLGLRLADMPPFLLVGLALLLGALCGIRHVRRWRVPWKILLLGVYGLFGFHFFLFLALRSAPPIEANLINYLWPLLIVLLAPVILDGYGLTVRHFAAALLGFVGAALLVTGGKLGFVTEHIAGYGFALISALIWSSYSLLTKRFGGFPTAAIGLFCLVSGLLALVCHFALEPRYVPTAGDLPLLLLLGFGPMGSAFFLWDAALKRGDPRVIGSLAYLTPMFSTLILAASSAGKLTAVSFAAMGLIIAAAVIGSLPMGSQRETKADRDKVSAKNA